MITGKINMNWKGKLAERQVVRAVEQGMNANLARCVQVVKPKTPVRTGILQGSMRMEPAKVIRRGVVAGFFGSWDVNYTIFVEKGTVRMSGRHMLEETASEVFPKLGEDIRAAVKTRAALR